MRVLAIDVGGTSVKILATGGYLGRVVGDRAVTEPRRAKQAKGARP